MVSGPEEEAIKLWEERQNAAFDLYEQYIQDPKPVTPAELDALAKDAVGYRFPLARSCRRTAAKTYQLVREREVTPLVQVLEELLKFGAHEGVCLRDEDMRCVLHLGAVERRRATAERVLQQLREEPA